MSTFASDLIGQFDDRWNEVSVIFRMAEELGDDDEKYCVLCRTAIVLIVANFEGFLQETLKSLIADINNNHAFLSSSEKMKRTFCGQFIESDKGNEKKVTKLVEFLNQLDVQYTLEPFLYENNKNPKATVIEKYFDEIGGKNFWGYITDCEIECVFENDTEVMESVRRNIQETLIEGIKMFPYSIDITSMGYNLENKKVSDECLWKVFLNQTLSARHNVAHGISFDNTMSLDEIKLTKKKVEILELAFASLVYFKGVL